METLNDVSKEVGLEVNTEKTKYMLLSRHQNAGKDYDIKIANRCFENVARFRYLGTTITNQNLIQEEIKRRFNSGATPWSELIFFFFFFFSSYRFHLEHRASVKRFVSRQFFNLRQSVGLLGRWISPPNINTE
jgi:hypothetical protein